jgi:hypothetical protein
MVLRFWFGMKVRDDRRWSWIVEKKSEPGPEEGHTSLLNCQIGLNSHIVVPCPDINSGNQLGRYGSYPNKEHRLKIEEELRPFFMLTHKKRPLSKTET